MRIAPACLAISLFFAANASADLIGHWPLDEGAGDTTADASATLAERSRSWAASVRESLRTEGGGQGESAAGTATATAEDVMADAGDPPPA